jgi:hypothetical protein
MKRPNLYGYNIRRRRFAHDFLALALDFFGSGLRRSCSAVGFFLQWSRMLGLSMRGASWMALALGLEWGTNMYISGLF